MDLGKPSDAIVLSGMGRGGTTWAANIKNYDNSFRILFEPFLAKKVSEAANFSHIQYVNPRNPKAELTSAALEILAGRVHNDWVDRFQERLFCKRRIVRDIRTNLMLGWLHIIQPEMPIILMIRHPFQVIDSWMRLGWKNEAFGKRSNIDTLLAQQHLLEDFPVIAAYSGSS